MKKLFLLLFVTAVLPLFGCAAFNSELTEYTLPEEEVGEREVTESSIDSLANEYHAKAVLDPNYLSEHGYNSSTFSTQAADTQAGIAQAKANYALAEAKYSYWSAVIDSIDVNALSDDFYATADSLDTLLYSIAEANEMSLSEMASEYGITNDDLTIFLDDAKSMLNNGFTMYDILDDLKTDVDETKTTLTDILLSAESSGTVLKTDAVTAEDDGLVDNEDIADEKGSRYYDEAEEDDETPDEDADDVINSSY